MSDLPPPSSETKEVPPQESGAAASQTVTTGTVSTPSFASRCFDLLAALGPLTLTVFAALHTVPALRTRLLFLPEETHLAAVHQTLAQSGNWAVPQFDGAPYTALPPAFFWFVEVLDRLHLPLGPEALLPAATVAGLLLFILAVWLLAQAAGNTRQTALAAGITALTAFSTAVWAHLALPDFLFSACVTLSSICLYRAWIKNSAPLLMLCGFAFAAAAALIQGPLGLGLPLLGSLIFLIWRGSFRRGGARDGALGFGLMLVLLLSWIAYVAFDTDGKAYLNAWIQKYTASPVLALPQGEEWTRAAQNLAWFWLPWTLLLPFLPWERIFSVPAAVWKNRTCDPGTGWLWCNLLSGLALLSLFPPDRPAVFLAVFPPLAVLTGRAATKLTPTRSRLFFGLLGLLTAAGAALFGLLTLAEHVPLVHDWLPATVTLPAPLPIRILPIPEQLPGLPWLAGVCALFALFSLILNKSKPAGGLLFWLLFCTAFIQPVNLITLPALAPLPTLEETSPPSLPENTAHETPPAVPSPPEVAPSSPADEPQRPSSQEQPAVQDVPIPSEQPFPPADAPVPDKPFFNPPAEETLSPSHEDTVPADEAATPYRPLSLRPDLPGSACKGIASGSRNRREKIVPPDGMTDFPGRQSTGVSLYI